MMGWQWHQLDHMQTICTSLQTDNHAIIMIMHYTNLQLLSTLYRQLSYPTQISAARHHYSTTSVSQPFIQVNLGQPLPLRSSFTTSSGSERLGISETGVFPGWMFFQPTISVKAVKRTQGTIIEQ